MLNKSDYHSKLETILNDKNIFTKLNNNNPTKQLKSKISKIINASNADIHNIKLPKIIGNYKPGHIDGTVKMHKPGYLLKPIISHVTTPIYPLTKTINVLITFPIIIALNLHKNLSKFLKPINLTKELYPLKMWKIYLQTFQF